jgi:hypothetical protein
MALSPTVCTRTELKEPDLCYLFIEAPKQQRNRARFARGQCADAGGVGVVIPGKVHRSGAQPEKCFNRVDPGIPPWLLDGLRLGPEWEKAVRDLHGTG